MMRIKRIRLLTVIYTLLLAMSVNAQEKELTLQDLIPGGKKLQPFRAERVETAQLVR